MDNFNKPSRFIDEINKEYINEEKTERKVVKSNSFQKIQKAVDETVDYQAGDKIMHDVFGEGVIISIEGSVVTIAFAHPHGIKKLLKGHKSIKKI